MTLRIRYAKLGPVRFTSHRDTARFWERALRRVAVPVATSGGFTPRPRIGFGLALPTGAESVAEYLDVELVAGRSASGGLLDDPAALVGALTDALPAGVSALVAAEVAGAPSLQQQVTSVTWELAVPADVAGRGPDGPGGRSGTGGAVAAAVERLIAAPSLPLERERKGERRVDDVRPQIMSLAVGADGATMVAELATVGRGLRPAELAAVAFPGSDPAMRHAVRARRTHQWIEHDGTRREVLALPGRVLAPLAGA